MGIKFEGRNFSVKVSRGDYVFRWGTLTVTKLGADWFVEGAYWGFRREPDGLVTVSQTEPRPRPVMGLGEATLSGPTIH